MSAKIVRLDLDPGWFQKPRAAGEKPEVRGKRRLADRYFSLDQLAKRFQCGYDLLYKAVRKKELEAIVVGRSYRVTEEAVDRYLEFCLHRKKMG